MSVSRRQFLKISGLSLATAILPPEPPDESPLPVVGLGRMIKGVNVCTRPSRTAGTITMLPAETIVNLYGVVQSEDNHYNRTWYRVRQGYIHSAYVQPVRWEPQTPDPNVPEGGCVGEVRVPYTPAKSGPGDEYRTVYRTYYGTTHWITAAQEGEDGAIWYKIRNERLQQPVWLKGAHIHRVTAAEIAPLSPHITNKRIEIDLARQVLRAYENDRLVLQTLCSTGPYMRTENGRRVYSTPAGVWTISRKRASRHMAGDEPAAEDNFDLPGVPWVSYFTWWGVSFHGTYWHNDYGRPHSHGCINLPCEIARWIFRWTLPAPSVTEEEIEGEGTQVIVY